MRKHPFLWRALVSLALVVLGGLAASAEGLDLEVQPYLQAPAATSVEVRFKGRAGGGYFLDWGTDPRHLAHSLPAETTTVKMLFPLETGGANRRRAVELQRVELTGLAPATTYFYRIRRGARRSGLYRFRTLPRRLERVRFLVYGDNRTHPADHRRVVRAMERTGAMFVINTGDMVSHGDLWPEWPREFFSPLQPLISEVPLFPVRGNHDDSRRTLTALFHFPGAPERVYYRFDAGPARFIVLDGTLWRSRPAMLAWLEEQLRQRPRPPWTFLFCHYPPFNSAAQRGYSRGWERERIAHLCQRYGVDIFFAGHDHNYMRTVPILAYRSLPGNPTTYVVTGGGGAPLYRPAHATYIRTVARRYHFCLVEVSGRELSLQAVDALTGEVFDHLLLRKDTAGRIVLPVDYRQRAEELAEVNALECLRRGLTALRLPALDGGQTLTLHRTVDNPFPGPVRVRVRLVDRKGYWRRPLPVLRLTLPARSEGNPFTLALTARQSIEDEPAAGYFAVEYTLWDGREGRFRGEGIRIARRRAD